MIEHDRLIAPAAVSPAEEAVERALRPKRLKDYVGQARIRVSGMTIGGKGGTIE